MILDEAALRALMIEAVRQGLHEERARMAPSAEEYLSVARAAKVVEVSQVTIRKWITEGKLARCTAGRELRVKRSELVVLIEGRAPSGTANADRPGVEAGRLFHEIMGSASRR